MLNNFRPFTQKFCKSYSTLSTYTKSSFSLKSLPKFEIKTKVVNFPRFPKPDKWDNSVPFFGEDAYFIASNPNTKVFGFGIADGVGAWLDLHHIDTSLFAWKLMEFCEKGIEIGITKPKDLLHFSYNIIQRRELVYAGSSTVCVITIKGDEENNLILESANLGDCAYMVFRDAKLIYKSPIQQHFFNCPYQLTIQPPRYQSDTRVTDKPSNAMIHTMNVYDGDMIIMASDGLFDNLFDEKIIQIVNEEEDYKRIAKRLLKETENIVKLPGCPDTPFSLAADENGISHVGGKLDDTTILVAVVQKF